MLRKWGGSIAVLFVLGGILLILALNLNLPVWRAAGSRGRTSDLDGNDALNPAGTSPAPPRPDRSAALADSGKRPAAFREYPIGEEVEKNQMRIAAVWLPPIQMDGMDGPSSSPLIHIEADIHATEGNRNGLSKDEFVPYLTVRYTIVSIAEPSKASSMVPISGMMMPMFARDGCHYGASIEMPTAGHFKVTYAIDPPAAGRHSDPITGVDPWWKPFEVSFDWDYPGPPAAR